MADAIRDYEGEFAVAVGRFWGVRDDQIQRQIDSGTVDAGTRGAVTAGLHLTPVEALIRKVLEEAGVPAKAISTGRKAATRLPGFFRVQKNWDIVVLDGTQVVLTVELKSQVGSFGKNQNNRVEEAIGQTYDYWKAAEEVMEGLRPWFGYLMIVEESPGSTSPVSAQPHIVPVDPIFDGASYVSRYGIAFDRMYKERLLDAACVAQSQQGSALVTYPNGALTFQHFAVALHNRVREYISLSGSW